MVRNAKDLRTSLLAITCLLIVIFGVPLLLVELAGDPIPHGLPSTGGIQHSLTSPISDTGLQHLLASVCWIIWALFSASVASELLAWTRQSSSVRLPIVGGAAQRLVLAAVLLFGTAHRQ